MFQNIFDPSKSVFKKKMAKTVNKIGRYFSDPVLIMRNKNKENMLLCF